MHLIKSDWLGVCGDKYRVFEVETVFFLQMATKYREFDFNITKRAGKPSSNIIIIAIHRQMITCFKEESTQFVTNHAQLQLVQLV